MPQYSSYVICGTPRSGSTLLCEMLAASGVAGRPNSYFREQSFGYWAREWGVPHEGGTDTVAFDRAFLPAMIREGTNGTGIFGLRLMWVSVAEASRRLDRLFGGSAAVTERLEQAFGPPLYIHLSRRDKVAQAVSLVRAEQSGLWHLAADGSVLEGDETIRPNSYDGRRIGELVSELESDGVAWDGFFKARGIEPVRLVYETMTADPQSALATVLAALGRDPALAQSVPVPTSKMGGTTSREWAERFRRENGLTT